MRRRRSVFITSIAVALVAAGGWISLDAAPQGTVTSSSTAERATSAEVEDLLSTIAAVGEIPHVAGWRIDPETWIAIDHDVSGAVSRGLVVVAGQVANGTFSTQRAEGAVVA